MISAIGRIPHQWHFHWIYVLLAGTAFIGGAFLTLDFKTVTVRQTRTVTLTPAQAVSRMTARQIVAALGHPDQTQTQNGVTCDLWQSRGIEVCFKA